MSLLLFSTAETDQEPVTVILTILQTLLAGTYILTIPETLPPGSHLVTLTGGPAVREVWHEG